jgi:hypothetical protein
VTTPLDNLLYPELRRFPPQDRTLALRKARRLTLDVVELLGIAAGLIVTTMVMRYGAAGMALNLGESALLAAAVLFVAVGPFLSRRTRRGLRRMLALRENAPHPLGAWR